MNFTQDLYVILGIPSNATMDDVHNAYRAATRRFHPDVNKHPGSAVQFREITAAYEILGDTIAREKYDSTRKKTGQITDKPYFTLRLTLSKRIVPILDEPQVLYALMELLPDRERSMQQIDSKLNLTLVVDHSTSMKEEGRLDRMKAAAYHVVDQLSDKDILSVVTFSDRADVLIQAAPVVDKIGIKARIATTQAQGATEMLQGLTAGLKENVRNAGKNFVNHIILITDGRTYGDELQCLALADQAAKHGIGISAMGIGKDWNDIFLDQLATRTGGTSEYINSPSAVTRFLNDRVKNLGQTYAERVAISLAPDPDIKIESAFRLTPNPNPILVETDPILVGQMQVSTITSIIFQLQLPPMQQTGFRSLMRVEVSGDIMRDGKTDYKAVTDTSIEVTYPNDVPAEDPPLVILDALGKLTLYRMQERAADAVNRGNVQEATQRLENLATRLLNAGQTDLANAAMAEARRVAQTNMLSEEGHLNLKYGTRLLIGASAGTGSMQTANLPTE
jgi:Ca-activated chloride channel family protein